MTKEITITSRHGTTMEFAPSKVIDGHTSLTMRGPDREFIRNLLISPEEIANFVRVFGDRIDTAPAKQSVYMVVRSKVGKPMHMRVCHAGATGTKEYRNKADAKDAIKRLNEQYGDKWKYFLVKVEV